MVYKKNKQYAKPINKKKRQLTEAETRYEQRKMGISKEVQKKYPNIFEAEE